MAHITVSSRTENDSPGNSIVEHPFGMGESPQWRNMTRSPKEDDACAHDQETQTEELDAQYYQKCRALEELEEDIDDAKLRLKQHQQLFLHHPTAADSPMAPGTLLLELESQRSSINALREEVTALRGMLATILLAVQQPAA